MIDRLKQIWDEATWWQRILIVLFFPILFALLWVLLLRSSQNADPAEQTAQTQAKVEEARQAKEEQIVNEYKSTTRGLEREHMKRRQEIQRIQTSEEMRRVLDEELNR